MKIKALLYCCKATKKNDYLTKIWINQYELSSLKEVVEQDTLNGKIVCECEVETEELTQIGCGGDIFITQTLDYFEILRHSCLKMEELSDYLYNPDKDSKGYALHLTNVKVFDKPRELSEYHISYYNKSLEMMREKHLTNAPQNMCRVFDTSGDYILISIQPQWLCMILNGEKDIEIRRKVLKGMI